MNVMILMFLVVLPCVRVSCHEHGNTNMVPRIYCHGSTTINVGGSCTIVATPQQQNLIVGGAPQHPSLPQQSIAQPNLPIHQPAQGFIQKIEQKVDQSGWRSGLIKKCAQCWDELLPHIREQFTKRGPSVKTFFKKNGWSIAWKGAIGAYVYLNYRLFRLITFLIDSERWIYWHHELSLAQLIEIPPEKLMHELLVAMHNRPKSLIKNDNTLKQILMELKLEIEAIEKYSAWAQRIMTFDDLQNRCAILCEGCLPSMFGLPLGCGLRVILSAASIKKIVYLHEGLIRSSPEYERRLIYLRRIVETYLHQIEK